MLNSSRLLRGVLGININAIFLWAINIFLLRIFPPEKKKDQVFRYLISFGIGLSLISVLVFILSPPPILEDGGAASFLQGTSIKYYPLLSTFTTNLFVLFLINLVINQQDKATLKLEVAQLEISNLLAQQEQLKQKIHPHFLFNALSTLMALIEKDKEAALKYTGSLSHFLRQSLTLAKKDKNKIEDELELLQEYLHLQGVRFRDAIQFEADIPENICHEGELPVFALQVLAENAIKHNAFDSSSPLRINIQYKEEGVLQVSNNRQAKYGAEGSTGIGLQNLGDRYALLGGNRPVIEEANDLFTVMIQVL